MRKPRIEALGLAALLIAGTLVVGQPGPAKDEKPPTPGKDEKKAPPKSQLEQMLEQALRNNPDIHVAEAKLHEAEAELNRTRLLVTQKVVTLHAGLDAARANVFAAEAQLERVKTAYRSKSIPSSEVDKATAALQQAKAELAKLESEAPYITGRRPVEPRIIDPTVERARLFLRTMQEAEADRDYALYMSKLALAHRAAPSDGPMAEKIRAALNKPITLNVKQTPLTEVLKQLESSTGLTILSTATAGDPPLTVRVENMQTGAVLQLLEDQTLTLRIFVRDYGLLVLPTDQEAPRGAVPVQDFWKSGKTETKDKPEKK